MLRTGIRGGDGGSAFGAGGGLMPLLSLFLVLLVFFIVLNAESRPRADRVEKVLASIDESFPAFRIDPRLRDGTDPVASRSGTVFAAERLSSLGDLFATAVAVAKVETVTPGRLMEVNLPADGLFLPGTADLRPDVRGLIDRVIDALRQSRAGERIELDALLAIDLAASSQPPGPVQRAATLARALTAGGAPPESVTVGVERGAAGTARLRFLVRLDEDRFRDRRPGDGP